MKSFKTKAQHNRLEAMIEFIFENTDKLRDNDKHMEATIRLVCEEVFVNIINYAYPDRSDGEIEIIYDEDLEEKRFSMTVIDYGVEFDPLKKKDPDISLDLDERPIGGLGVYIVKQIMDELKYERKDGKNIFYMEKKL